MGIMMTTMTSIIPIMTSIIPIMTPIIRAGLLKRGENSNTNNEG
jgi:hypothetical protein